MDAWIIDACRTPRGIGKVGKGALAEIHPQQLGATVLARAGRAQRDQHRRGRRRHLGHQRAARAAGRRPRPDVGARRRLRRARERRHARPLLRLGHHRVNLAAASRSCRACRGSGDRRRHRDDVDGKGRRSGGGPLMMDAGNLRLRARHPQIAPGRLRRRHRHAWKASPARMSTGSRWKASSAPRMRSPNGHFDKSLVPVYHEDGTLALDQRGVPAAADHAGRARRR